jgi:hypothetical protein
MGYHRAALFDVDGVLADESHRSKYAEAKDWGTYFDPRLVLKDGVFKQGVEVYNNAALCGMDRGYLTGRREDLADTTRTWMDRSKAFDSTLPLIMRKMAHLSRDGWKLPILKARIVAEALHVYDEVHLWDDDPEVIKAVRQVPGARAHHCTWHKKPEAMVRRGVA